MADSSTSKTYRMSVFSSLKENQNQKNTQQLIDSLIQTVNHWTLWGLEEALLSLHAHKIVQFYTTAPIIQICFKTTSFPY